MKTLNQLHAELDECLAPRSLELPGNKARVSAILREMQARFPAHFAEINGDKMLVLWETEIDWGKA